MKTNDRGETELEAGLYRLTILEGRQLTDEECAKYHELIAAGTEPPPVNQSLGLALIQWASRQGEAF